MPVHNVVVAGSSLAGSVVGVTEAGGDERGKLKVEGTFPPGLRCEGMFPPEGKGAVG